MSEQHELKHCPFCGHATAEDMSVEKRDGHSVVFCPAERLRLSFALVRSEASKRFILGMIYVEKF